MFITGNNLNFKFQSRFKNMMTFFPPTYSEAKVPLKFQFFFFSREVLALDRDPVVHVLILEVKLLEGKSDFNLYLQTIKSIVKFLNSNTVDYYYEL